MLLNGITSRSSYIFALEKQQRTCLLFLHEQLLAIQMGNIHCVNYKVFYRSELACMYYDTYNPKAPSALDEFGLNAIIVNWSLPASKEETASTVTLV